MFTGVGGFELGLESANRACNKLSKPNEESIQSNRNKPLPPCEVREDRSQHSFNCIGQSEIDKYSSQVLKYRFPNITNYGDCTKIDPSKLPDFDMLCGGFPCQAFSIAGKRRGFEDTRGTMFFEIARILEVKRPKIILLENVKGLLNHDKGKTFRVILQTLDELGYEVQWMVLNSKFHGVSQNRERVFIIGNLRGTSRLEILPFTESYKFNIQQDEEFPEQISNTIRGNYSSGFSNETYAYCLDANYHKGETRPEKRQRTTIIDANRIRRLTPVECCRLQGFPDDWNEFGIDDKGEKVKMSDTQRYKQMGNAVTTNVIHAVGSKILPCTNENNEMYRVQNCSPNLNNTSETQ